MGSQGLCMPCSKNENSRTEVCESKKSSGDSCQGLRSWGWCYQGERESRDRQRSRGLQAVMESPLYSCFLVVRSWISFPWRFREAEQCDEWVLGRQRLAAGIPLLINYLRIWGRVAGSLSSFLIWRLAIRDSHSAGKIRRNLNPFVLHLVHEKRTEHGQLLSL